MSRTFTLDPSWVPAGTDEGLLARTYRRQVLKLIESLDDARIEWHEAGEVRVLECAKPARFRFRIDILDPAFYRKVALGGSVGAGESYMDGDWRVDDLTQVIQTLVHNRDALDAMEGGLASLAVPVLKLFERMRRNTREGSKRNILAHYDLGDRLFSRFLDPTMMYSSAVFEHEDQTLDEAAVAKLDRICRKLDLGPGDHLLEIGTGWGGLAIHAARTTGCRVTTTTISDNQYAHAKQAVVAAGLDDRITVLDCDYRDLDGTYDKLVSVEMVEAVGHQFLDQYIQKCASLLKPDGLFLMQAILIEDHRYLQARDSVDFIKRHVFPGSFIPSVGAITESAARGTDLKLSHFEEFGDSYARTLQVWRERFLARWDELSSLGYSEEFRRLWEFYLCYCEGGFRERSISVGQFVYARPGDRRAAILPKSEVLR